MGTPQPDTEQQAILREKVSEGFRAYTEDAVVRHVTYKLGAKDGKTQIDCAGFIEKAVRRVFEDYLTNGEKLEIKNNKNQTHVFDCGADDQISEVSRKTGVLLKGNDVNLKTIKEGMIIGMGTADKVSWAGDRNLWNNISHIVLVYKDPESGELMVGQSSGSGGGANAKPLKDWMQAAKAQGWSLYATDVVKLAANIDAKPSDAPPQAVATAVRTGADVTKSFLGAFPDISGAFGISSQRHQTSPAVAPGAKPTTPTPQKLTH